MMISRGYFWLENWSLRRGGCNRRLDCIRIFVCLEDDFLLSNEKVRSKNISLFEEICSFAWDVSSSGFLRIKVPFNFSESEQKKTALS